MAFVHGKSGRVLLDSTALSVYVRSWEHTTERELADVTVETDDGHKWIPGLDSGSVSVSGLLDTDATAGGQDATLAAARGASTANVVTLAPDGFAVGNRVVPVEARETAYAVASPVADAVSWTSAWRTEGQVDVGVALHDLAAETTSGTSTAVDNGTSTASGGVGALHVTAFTGLTSVDITVQDSDDEQTWVDLVTFTQVTGTTSERVAVTGSVDQHVRAEWDTTGTGSVTFAVAFARR